MGCYEMVPRFKDITPVDPEDDTRRVGTTTLQCTACNHKFTQWKYTKMFEVVCPNCRRSGAVGS